MSWLSVYVVPTLVERTFPALHSTGAFPESFSRRILDEEGLARAYTDPYENACFNTYIAFRRPALRPVAGREKTPARPLARPVPEPAAAKTPQSPWVLATAWVLCRWT